MKQAGRGYHQQVQSASAGRRAEMGPPQVHIYRAMVASLLTQMQAMSPAPAEPAGTVDQLLPRSSKWKQRSQKHEYPEPGKRRSPDFNSEFWTKPFGSQSWVSITGARHMLTPHRRTSRADLGTSSQRSSGHGNMNQLIRCSSVGPPLVHSLPVSVAQDDHIGDTNNGDQSALFPSVAVTRVESGSACTHVSSSSRRDDASTLLPSHGVSNVSGRRCVDVASSVSGRGKIAQIQHPSDSLFHLLTHVLMLTHKRASKKGRPQHAGTSKASCF